MPDDEQLRHKQAQAEQALSDQKNITWLPPVASRSTGFRNKAKMVVGGTVQAPTLGILNAERQGVDLSDCPLYPEAIRQSFAPIKTFITRANIQPYDVANRTGELKHVLISLSSDASQALMLRFVLRSREAEPRIIKHLSWLKEQLPTLSITSINLLPQHTARVEGDTERTLGDDTMLPMPMNDLPMFIQPGSFFQTNTQVAEALYRQAQEWMAEIQPKRVLDVYCGVGGFALHAATLKHPPEETVGIEISHQAIECANQSASLLTHPNLTFHTQNATELDLGDTRNTVVIVNPPRRGIGEALAKQINQSNAEHVIYSSCNPDTLASDLKHMPNFKVTHARMLDMFPHTDHFEVIVRMARMSDS